MCSSPSRPGDDVGGLDAPLGVADDGRFAVVTNLGGHGPAAPDRPSRDQLLWDFLTGTSAYRKPADADLAALNPFSLITVDENQALFTVNRPTVRRVGLGAGVYGLSNGGLDEPWPKTMRLKAVVAGWLEEPSPEPKILFDALRLGTPPEPGRSGPAGPGGAIFIRNPVYGTRCSTIVAIDAWGGGMIMERRFDSEGCQTGETCIPFEARVER